MKRIAIVIGLLACSGIAYAHNFCTEHSVVNFVQSQTGTTCHSNGTLAWSCPTGGPSGQAFLIWGQGPTSPSSNHGQYLLQIFYGTGFGTANVETIVCDCNGDPNPCRVTHTF